MRFNGSFARRVSKIKSTWSGLLLSRETFRSEASLKDFMKHSLFTSQSIILESLQFKPTEDFICMPKMA